MKNAIVHFELPADSLPRAQSFYQKTFGWKITPWKSLDLEYWSAVTKDPKQEGINGGMMPRVPGQPLTIYMNVDSIDAITPKIIANGGSICMQKREIAPGMGWIAMFLDTEGNSIGLHEASLAEKKDMSKKPAKKVAKKASKPAAKKKTPKKTAAKKKK